MEKEKIFSLKNFISDEKTSGARLQSIRLPRDLNLGGTKTQKKVYTPNLNVVRNKDKSKEFLKKTEQKRKEKFNKHEKNSKQNNSKQPRYVQSMGLFSEGAGSDVVKSYREKRSTARDYEERAAMVRPTINKTWNEINIKTEDGILDDLLGVNDEDSDEEKMIFEPITWNQQNFKEPPGIHKTEHLKHEHNPNVMANNNIIDLIKEDDSLSDNNPSISMWTLPDSFAGKGFSDDPNVKTLLDYPLNHMLEGHIGKVTIRKSGKVEVHVGRIKYDLELSNLAQQAEEVVVLEKNKSGVHDAAVLGEIENRYILSPDWMELLKNL